MSGFHLNATITIEGPRIARAQAIAKRWERNNGDELEHDLVWPSQLDLFFEGYVYYGTIDDLTELCEKLGRYGYNVDFSYGTDADGEGQLYFGPLAKDRYLKDALTALADAQHRLKRLGYVPALEMDSESDYTLSKDCESVWITVENISVYIKRDEEGVAVDLFPKDKECDESLAGTWLMYDEASTDEEL